MINHDHTKEWWDNFWKNPEQHFGEPRQSLIDVVENHTRALENKESVLLVDIGSGNGRYAIPFALLGYDTTAIEKSDTACEIISQRASREGVDVTILHNDILSLDLQADRTFDIVFSSGLIEEIDSEDQLTAVDHIKRLTKNNGLLVLKYCLEIKDRGVTVKEGLIGPLFSNDPEWEVQSIETDPEMRESNATIDFENRLRTETIIAFRRFVARS